ncbi:V-type ATP synthase subunit I [Solibaculum mannosilyticum]|nr:V-type ATP synthase subunit I [Eubacteriaceae bacterium CHKCI005]
MAIVQMKRIHIVALQTDRKAILEHIQRFEAVEVRPVRGEDDRLSKKDTSRQIATFDRGIQTAKEALAILDEKAAEKKVLFAPRRQVDKKQYRQSAGEWKQYLDVAQEILALSKEAEEHRSAAVKLEAQIETLRPWERLDVPMKEKGSAHTAAMIGTLPEEITPESIRERLPDLPEETYLEVVSSTREQTCLFVASYRPEAERVESLLRTIGFGRPGWSLSHRTCREKIQRLEQLIAEHREKAEQCEQSIVDHREDRRKLEFLSDYLAMRREKYEVLERLGLTEHVFVLEGYVPAKAAGKIAAILEKRYGAYVELLEPDDPEDVPKAFQNGPFVAPVEGITASYSMPGTHDLDPNPVMAFFYYLLFGMMLSDAGYGILISIATGYIGFFSKAERRTKNTMRMFFYCGLSTTFWGALYGSWFGNAVGAIAENFLGSSFAIAPIWFDPSKDPMTLLIFSIAVGVVHILLGLGVKFYNLCRQGKPLDAVFDAGFWMLAIAGLSIMAAGMVALPETVLGNVGIGMTVVGFLGLLCTQGRDKKNILGKILGGIMSLYDITGFFSDILSYSRLMALGLTTGIIATTINTLGALPGKGVVGVIAFAVIFVAGHAMNLAINMLGAYVHCNRLHYVEFFKQFYEGGGKLFTPFAVNTQYIRLKEEQQDD